MRSVSKVSEGGGRDRVAVAHQHKIGHLMPYLDIQWPGHVPVSAPGNTTLLLGHQQVTVSIHYHIMEPM